MTNPTEIVQIPLNKLTKSDHNVRKTGDKSVAELAASIQAHGLLHNLVVTETKNEKYKVIAGARRFAAQHSRHRSGRRRYDGRYRSGCRRHRRVYSLSRYRKVRRRHPTTRAARLRCFGRGDSCRCPYRVRRAGRPRCTCERVGGAADRVAGVWGLGCRVQVRRHRLTQFPWMLWSSTVVDCGG